MQRDAVASQGTDGAEGLGAEGVDRTNAEDAPLAQGKRSILAVWELSFGHVTGTMFSADHVPNEGAELADMADGPTAHSF